MDEKVAAYLVRSLLARLSPEGNNYTLGNGRISAEEVEALALFAGERRSEPLSTASSAPSAPALHGSSVKLDLSCLDADSRSSHVCLDFGTAFSKAAYWSEDDDAPIPLDLGSFGDGDGTYPVQSCAYVTDGNIFFGGTAQSAFDRENNDAREIFSSPKQYLTHAFSDLDCKASSAIDPTQSFTTGELLTLYLGYLAASASERLETLGFDRHVARRYALPGWNNAQIDTPSDSGPAYLLKSQFLKAQILADSIDAGDWQAGIGMDVARKVLDELARIEPQRLDNSTFQAQPVLEAIAASAGVHEKFQNSRPQLLVVDVGAGTTDIGVFKVATPQNRAPLAFPYKNGMAALRRAGDNVDEILVNLASSELGVSNGSQLAKIVQRKMRQRVRGWKSELFERGQVTIEVEDYDAVTIELDQFLATPQVGRFSDLFRTTVIDTLNNCGIGSRNFIDTKDQNLVVFTGGGSRLPFLTAVFEKPLALTDGPVTFEIADPEPEWAREFGPDFQRVFPQLAVATGGAAPDIPDRKSQVIDTRHAAERRVQFFTG